LPLAWQIQSHCDWVGVVTSAEATSRTLANVALNTLAKDEETRKASLLIFNDVTNAKPVDISFGLLRRPDVFVPYAPDFQNLPEPSSLSQLLSIVTHQEEVK